MSQYPPDTQRVSLEIAVPEESHLGQDEARQLARESFYIELYRRGAIGSGRAAALLNIERSAFLDLLAAHGVSWFDETIDIEQEARNAQPAIH